MKKILITGAAGFIGHHLSKLLLKNGYEVVGIDNINDYYDVNLKLARLEDLGIDTSKIEYNKAVQGKIKFIKLDLVDKDNILELFKNEKFNFVMNLAAQAGVRYSLINPHAYVDSNITGFLNILEGCRAYPVEHLLYASSSSVYGLSEEIPFNTNSHTDHPLAMYAASKKCNEMMAHSYSYLYKIPSTGLRFFTVYGPWGRPDMALHIFTKAIVEDKEFEVFNNGDMSRDFTYVDDIVDGIINVIDNPATSDENWDATSPDPSSSKAPYKVYNIGNNEPVKLMDFIQGIEKKLGMEAEKNFMDMQPGDVQSTYADVQGLIKDMNYKPDTSITDGISAFVDWYREFYKPTR